jgi:hypothetical protein
MIREFYLKEIIQPEQENGLASYFSSTLACYLFFSSRGLPFYFLPDLT